MNQASEVFHFVAHLILKENKNLKAFVVSPSKKKRKAAFSRSKILILIVTDIRWVELFHSQQQDEMPSAYGRKSAYIHIRFAVFFHLMIIK